MPVGNIFFPNSIDACWLISHSSEYFVFLYFFAAIWISWISIQCLSPWKSGEVQWNFHWTSNFTVLLLWHGRALCVSSEVHRACNEILFEQVIRISKTQRERPCVDERTLVDSSLFSLIAHMIWREWDRLDDDEESKLPMQIFAELQVDIISKLRRQHGWIHTKNSLRVFIWRGSIDVIVK